MLLIFTHLRKIRQPRGRPTRTGLKLKTDVVVIDSYIRVEKGLKRERERKRALSGRATCEVKWTWLLKLKGERRIRTPQIREKTPARRKKKTRSSRRRRGEAKARTRRRRRTGANRGEAKLLQFARFCVVVPAFVLDLDNVAKFCERSLSLSAMCVRVYI